jgi:hypothetical protein
MTLFYVFFLRKRNEFGEYPKNRLWHALYGVVLISWPDLKVW